MRKNIKFHAIYIRNVSKSLRNFCAKISIGNPTFIAMYERKGVRKNAVHYHDIPYQKPYP